MKTSKGDRKKRETGISGNLICLAGRAARKQADCPRMQPRTSA
jgi:hypothetical protein